jgi:hypothetical protein
MTKIERTETFTAHGPDRGQGLTVVGGVVPIMVRISSYTHVSHT